MSVRANVSSERGEGENAKVPERREEGVVNEGSVGREASGEELEEVLPHGVACERKKTR